MNTVDNPAKCQKRRNHAVIGLVIVLVAHIIKTSQWSDYEVFTFTHSHASSYQFARSATSIFGLQTKNMIFI